MIIHVSSRIRWIFTVWQTEDVVYVLMEQDFETYTWKMYEDVENLYNQQVMYIQGTLQRNTDFFQDHSSVKSVEKFQIRKFAEHSCGKFNGLELVLFLIIDLANHAANL